MESAIVEMTQALNAKRSVIRRRKDFERWRHEVALEAANEAFNASAGRAYANACNLPKLSSRKELPFPAHQYVKH